MNSYPKPWRQNVRGFTLVEAIMVIVLTGILAGMAAVFIRAPITAYQDATRRAELTDIADTALRRIARDVRGALPNSVRVSGTCTGPTICFLEYVPIKSAGRYRESGPGNPLDFNAAADTFDVIGPGVDIAANDFIVIYNLALIGSDVYVGTSRRDVTTTGTGLVTAGYSGGAFPFASPARRFQVVGKPATYACNPPLGQLQRYSNYAYVDPQPQPPAGTPALLATNVSTCRFAYQALSALNALITLELGVSKGSETVSLVYQIHVNNVP
jgi:MSHA biogenesis protein MshO